MSWPAKKYNNLFTIEAKSSDRTFKNCEEVRQRNHRKENLKQDFFRKKHDKTLCKKKIFNAMVLEMIYLKYPDDKEIKYSYTLVFQIRRKNTADFTSSYHECCKIINLSVFRVQTPIIS